MTRSSLSHNAAPARSADRPQASLAVRARRMGYVVGAAIALVVFGAGILGWYAAGASRAQASAWIGLTLVVMVGIGIIFLLASMALARDVEKSRKEHLGRAVRFILRAREDNGPASREQASLVAAWSVETSEGALSVPRVVVRNASHMPVFQVRVVFHRAGNALGHLDLGVLPPNSNPVSAELPDDIVRKVSEERASRSDVPAWQPEVDLVFFDAAGVIWWRNSTGLLKEMKRRNSAFDDWQPRPAWTDIGDAPSEEA